MSLLLVHLSPQETYKEGVVVRPGSGIESEMLMVVHIAEIQHPSVPMSLWRSREADGSTVKENNFHGLETSLIVLAFDLHDVERPRTVLRSEWEQASCSKGTSLE